MSVARLSTVALACALPFTISAQSDTPPSARTHPAYPTTTSTPLATQITMLLADGNAARAHWGIAVTELDGTPIYGIDEGKLFRPASNAKLFTTAAAMALLGPDTTVETTVEGDMGADGIVKGDLRLVGHGDANFGANDLPYIAPKLRPKDTPAITSVRDIDELVNKLKQAGLKEVKGNIVGDDAEFPYQPVVGSWDFGDLVWGYGAPVSALTIADNQLTLTVRPGAILLQENGMHRQDVSVSLDQYGVDFYTVSSQVLIGQKGSGTHVNVERPAPHSLRVYGSIAPEAAPDIEHISVDEPALYAAKALRSRLIENGIIVDGSAQAFHFPLLMEKDYARSPEGCELEALGSGKSCASSCLSRPPGKVLAAHTSTTLAEDATYTLKVSQNLHAELMSRRLGKRLLCADPTSTGGARLTTAFTQKLGVDADDLFLYDGSGLSGHDLITPRSAAQLLVYATKQPWFAQWKTALPVGGEDGSLASRFADAPLKGHVFAKTGTLGESRALSGYLDCASGKQVIFSILVDDHTPSGSNDRDIMDKIVAAIAANN